MGNDPDSDRSDREVLLTEYEQLQENLRSYQRRWHRRITRGMIGTVIGVGYILETNQPEALAFVPLALTPLIIAHVIGENSVIENISKMKEIEEEIDICEFDFISKHSILAEDATSLEKRFPILAMNLAIGIVYFAIMISGLYFSYRNYSTALTTIIIVLDVVFIVIIIGLHLSNRRLYKDLTSQS